MSSRSVRFWVVGLVMVLFAAACGGDDTGSTTTVMPEEVDPAAADDASHGCVETVLVGATPNNADFSGSDALAIADGTGGYTLYLANFEIDSDNPGTAPDGLTVYTVSIAAGSDGLVVGDELSLGNEAPSFTLTAQDGGVDSTGTEAADGQLWINEMGDQLCGEISYFEADLRLSGTFEADATD